MSDFLIAHQIKDSLANLLHEKSDDRYSVVGYREINFSEEKAITPIIYVTIGKGIFPDKKRARLDNYTHRCLIRIIIIASASAQLNLNIISNPDASESDRANAMLESVKASKLADIKILKIIKILFDIINGVENYTLGFPDDNIINKKDFSGYEILDEIETGSMVTKKAVADLYIEVFEHPEGVIGTEIESPGINGYIELHTSEEDESHTDEEVTSQ